MGQIANLKKRLEKIRHLKSKFLEIAHESTTPIYVYDKGEVQGNIRAFKNAFLEQDLDVSVFFATKSNPYRGLLRDVVTEADGLDVSSQRELKLALEASAKKIIYTGPAKTEEDFELILQHHSKIAVNLESIRELELLAKMAASKGVVVRCGVRVYTKMQAGWTKFGIPLSDLKNFSDEAQKYKSIKFCGVHFHISFNKNPEKYVKTFEELGQYFKAHCSEQERLKFEYIDMGGGIYPEPFEGVYPWNPDQETTIENHDEILEKIASDKYIPRYQPIEVDHISKFAKEIGAAFKKFIITVLPNVKLYAEPGRFISHSSMHFLLKIIDVKNQNLGITDGGTNMVGWEKYQFFNYVPLFNLSQFDLKNEIPFLTCGSLCTPDDIWGYYMYTKGIPKSGDVILMPYQGAYTYTLAQNFIKDVPEVYDLV